MKAFNSSGLNRRDFLKVGGMSTVALALGATGVYSMSGAMKGFAAEQNSTMNPTSGFGGHG